MHGLEILTFHRKNGRHGKENNLMQLFFIDEMLILSCIVALAMQQ
jgi:hypothetical protein